MRVEIHGARIFIFAETKQDLTDMNRVIREFPSVLNTYWLVLDSNEVDISCDIKPIGEK